MNDRPCGPELVAAVRHFLETELLPALSDPRLRFQTLIAANVLSIAEREALQDETDLREEWREISGLLKIGRVEPDRLKDLRAETRTLNDQLAESIQAGQFQSREDCMALRETLRAMVRRKLAIANPRFLAGETRTRNQAINNPLSS